MSGDSKARGSKNWPKRVKLGVIVVVIVFVLIVLFQNNENRAFNILFWHPQVPPSALLLVTFAAGVLSGAVALHMLRRRRG